MGRLVFFGGLLALGAATYAGTEMYNASSRGTQLDRTPTARGPNISSPAPGESPLITDRSTNAVEISVELGDDDPGDEAWDEVPSQRRVEVLREEFETALASIERGEEQPQSVTFAEQALASLRAELYGTAAGRVDHQVLEDRLLRITEEATRPPDVEESRKSND